MDTLLNNELLAGGVLFFIRTVVALRLTPFIGGRPLPTVVCLGLAFALSLIEIPTIVVSITNEMTPGTFVLFAMREILIGASLGLLAYIVFSVLEMIGSLAGLASLSIADASDDITPSEAPIKGLYVFFCTGVFILIGGHHSLFAALDASAKCIPVGVASGGEHLDTLLDSAAGLFAGAFAWAFMVTTPMFVAGLFAEIFSGVATRMIPSLGQTAGGQTLRLFVVHFVLIALLGASVSAAVVFLRNGISDLPICAI